MDLLIEALLLMKYNCRLNRLSLYLAQRNRSTTSSYQHVFEDVLVTGEKGFSFFFLSSFGWGNWM